MNKKISKPLFLLVLTLVLAVSGCAAELNVAEPEPAQCQRTVTGLVSADVESVTRAELEAGGCYAPDDEAFSASQSEECHCSNGYCICICGNGGACERTNNAYLCGCGGGA